MEKPIWRLRAQSAFLVTICHRAIKKAGTPPWDSGFTGVRLGFGPGRFRWGMYETEAMKWLSKNHFLKASCGDRAGIRNQAEIIYP